MRNKFQRPGILIMSVDPSMNMEDLKTMVTAALSRFMEHTTNGEATIISLAELQSTHRDPEAEILVQQILKTLGNCNKQEFIGRFIQAVSLGEIDQKTVAILRRMDSRNQFLKANGVDFLPELASSIRYAENSEDVIFSRFRY